MTEPDAALEPRQSAAHTSSAAIPLHAIFRVAVYYGVAGFGGGYSILAQIRRDLVDRRRWIRDEDFLVIAELSKTLPGTPATSLLALLGQRVGGWRGGAIAAGAFLLPSVAIMIGTGASYGLLRRSTNLTLFFDGMNAALVGVVGAVTLDLARVALRTRRGAVAAIGCAALLAARLLTEPVLALFAIVGGASFGALRARGVAAPAANDEPRARNLLGAVLPLPFVSVFASSALVGLVQAFVPIGVMTFGGGLAMIPAIDRLVVTQHHWLDAKAFADAMALGQITPGPVAICATFIGYRVGGLVGALTATVAMFAPAVALALLVGRSVERFHGNQMVQGALRALAPAVIAMLLAATWSLGQNGIALPIDAIIAAATFALLARLPAVSPLWPLAGGGLVHLAAERLFHFG